MRKIAGALRRHRTEIAVGLLRALTYLGLMALFFGLLGIPNWQLRHINRTLATTLLTWTVMTVTMIAVYGGYDIGKKKSKPIISSMALANLCVDLVTYLQLQIMNVNPDNRAHLTLFGEDFWWLMLAAVLQTLYLILMVRVGNRIYFRIRQPRACLLILDAGSDRDAMAEKISRYSLQWHVSGTALWSDPGLADRIERADAVFLADVPDQERMRLMKICYDLHRDVLARAQLQDIMLSAAQPLVIDDSLFLEMDYHKMSLGQRILKRLGDILVSLAVLVIASPLMLLIALAILLTDGRPVFFRQERLTVGGRRFTIRKFRTMRSAAPEGTAPAESEVEQDPRVTPLGRFLRRARLDELPQFWNILVGDMTLVGPRPEMLDNIQRYKSAMPTFVYREKMKAGLTGYAQIEGRYNTNPEDKLMLDLMYIESFSLWNDVRLLFRTLTVFFKKDSAAPFVTTDALQQEERKDDACQPHS